MRVSCQSVEDFVENLQEEFEDGHSVFEDMVRVSIHSNPDDGPRFGKFAAVKWKVVFQATAVVCVDDENQYLLECGIDCGLDYRDSEPTSPGTEMAEGLKKKLEEYCEKAGLKIRPGDIDF